MSFVKLNSAQFHAVMIAGCQRLIHHKQLINEINVFPVADGDTGDNLSSTCHAIIEFSSAKLHLADTLISIADASIIGARGNSGIIFSQFFNLLAAQIPRVDFLEFREFSHALMKISTDIAAAISKPVQGTMITIIQKLALHAETKKDHCAFPEAMLELLPLLFLEVEKTKDTLHALKQANVVDAGALGFYYFIEGFTECLQHADITDSVKSDMTISTVHHDTLAANPPDFRYCTEAILKTTSFNKEELLHFLQNQGECASLSGNERISRLHVHTNNPRKLFTTLYKEHLIQYPKVDDMLRQYELQFNKKHKIALVTDSSADLPQSIIDQYQIHQICLNIHIDEHQLLDKYSFEPDYFYQQLNHFKTYPKSSCSNTKLIEDKLAIIAKHYDNVLVLSISSQMSGIHEAFKTASQQFKNISVVDTKTNSGAHGLLLHYAGQLIAEGHSFSDIISLIDKAIKNTFIFVMVNQFEAMVRSGRVNKISGKIAQLIKIKPIVSIDSNGRGMVVAKCFSHESAHTQLIHLVNQKLRANESILEDYCIVHADELHQANTFAQRTAETFNKVPSFIEPVSLSIGLHAGKGCIAIAARIRDQDI